MALFPEREIFMQHPPDLAVNAVPVGLAVGGVVAAVVVLCIRDPATASQFFLLELFKVPLLMPEEDGGASCRRPLRLWKPPSGR